MKKYYRFLSIDLTLPQVGLGAGALKRSTSGARSLPKEAQSKVLQQIILQWNCS